MVWAGKLEEIICLTKAFLRNLDIFLAFLRENIIFMGLLLLYFSTKTIRAARRIPVTRTVAGKPILLNSYMICSLLTPALFIFISGGLASFMVSK